MNCLNTSERVKVVAGLVEGCGINAICRMTGVSKPTVLKLLSDLGRACYAYHDAHVRGLKSKRVQCDEIWSFVGAKMKNTSEEKMADGWGDSWTWTAIDADSKLIVTYHVGDRGKAAAYEFMQDCAERIVGR